jgi:hypothetical protein
MVNPNEIVVKMARALNRAGIPFMIVGAISANVYGIERNTQDGDFVIQVHTGDMQKLVTQLGEDFQLDPQLSFETLVAMGNYFVARHLHPLFKIELFLVGEDAVSQEQFRRARKVNFQGEMLSFISPEDLIITKLRWFLADPRRTKDVQDIRGVLAVQAGKLDMAHIRQGCAAFGTLELLEDLLGKLPPLA